MIYFGYTYCPDVCPTELQSISLALDKLGRSRRCGAAAVHHRRSGARHAGAACRFCLLVSPAIDRPDRLACRDPQNRDCLQDVLRQKQHRHAGPLFGRPYRIHLSGRQGRALSRLPAARSRRPMRSPTPIRARLGAEVRGTYIFCQLGGDDAQEHAADAGRTGTGGRKRTS